MDVLEILRALARRWYVTVPLLALTLIGSLYARSQAESTFSTTAVLLFVGSNTSVTYDGDTPVEVPQNPLINSAGAEIAAIITAQSLLSDEVRSDVRVAGLDAAYTVESDRRTPVLEISVTSAVSGDALRATTLLVDTAEAKLVERQDAVGAPPASRLGFQVLRMPTREFENTRAKIRNGLGVAAAGLVVTVSTVAAVEGAVQWRRRRHQHLDDANPGHLDRPIAPAAPERNDPVPGRVGEKVATTPPSEVDPAGPVDLKSASGTAPPVTAGRPGDH